MSQTPPTDPPPTSLSSEPTQTYIYQAQTVNGQPIDGTIEAGTTEAAQYKLSAMGLRVSDIRLAEPPSRPRAMRRDEFLAFNMQLAQLTAAGLPVEKGLRLIAREMRSGRLRNAVEDIAADLEAGRPLAEAFDHHRGRFPALYGKIIDAGVKTSNLPGMLFNLGRHLELVNRLRATLWQALSYPMVILLGILAILVLIGSHVVPQFYEIFTDFDTELPWISQSLFSLTQLSPVLLIVLIVIIIGGPLLLAIMRLTGTGAYVADALALPLPLVGRCLRYNLLARWCNALRLGVEAGLALPEAIDLSGQALGSPSLCMDGERMKRALESGQDLSAVSGCKMVPPAVLASIDLASHQNDLPSALAGLTVMYEQQAELRLGFVRAMLGPVFLLILACLMLYVVFGLFLPLVTLVSSLT